MKAHSFNWLPGVSRGLLLIALALLAYAPATLRAQTYPTWWSTYGVISSGSASDFSLANQGQAKTLAVAAVTELDNDLPQFGGAGPALDSLANTLLTGTATATDFAVINLGQLKTLLTGPELPVASDVAVPWDIGYFIEFLKPKLGEHNAEFLTALVAALNDRTKLSALAPFPEWRNQPPVPLDTAWPSR